MRKTIGTVILGLFLVSAVSADAARDSRWSQKRNEGQGRCEKKCTEECTCPGRPECMGCGPGQGMCDNMTPSAYNKPARIDPACGWDFYLSGSFIYWLAAQQGMQLGYYTTADSPVREGAVTQDNDFKPGFKIAIGGNLNHDDWVAELEWTRLHFSTLTHSERPVGGTLELANNGQNLISLGSKWRCNLDVVDFEMARPYYQGKMLIFSPFVGPRGGVLNQKLKMDLTATANPTVTTQQNSKSKSWFLGIRSGFDAKWELGMGFRVATSVAGALLYQSTKATVDVYSFTSTPTNTNVLKEKFRNLTPNAEVGLGFGWGSYFYDSKYHLDILAQYEFHYWWNQNAMSTLADLQSNNFSYNKPGDLSYQGLTLTMRMDF